MRLPVLVILIAAGCAPPPPSPPPLRDAGAARAQRAVAASRPATGAVRRTVTVVLEGRDATVEGVALTGNPAYEMRVAGVEEPVRLDLRWRTGPRFDVTCAKVFLTRGRRMLTVTFRPDWSPRPLPDVATRVRELLAGADAGAGVVVDEATERELARWEGIRPPPQPAAFAARYVLRQDLGDGRTLRVRVDAVPDEGWYAVVECGQTFE